MSANQDMLARAQNSLEGLSVGDAFGELFFLSWEIIERLIRLGEFEGPPYDVSEDYIRTLVDRRRIPAPPTWLYTDDTQMALSVFENLRLFGKIDQDSLAQSFGNHYNSARGYGAAMHALLPAIRDGADWRSYSAGLFGGQGSFGNGAAMRVAPIGAYFADDLDAVAHHAALSATVTHAHDEAVAGAVAVAVAAAQASRLAAESDPPLGADFIESVLASLPDSQVRRGIETALDFDDSFTVEEVAEVLGSGVAVTAQDTVPFVIWCAAQHLDCYEEALWLTVAGLGDRDTTCAMVGGIVAARRGVDGIPSGWLSAREALPDWPFSDQ